MIALARNLKRLANGIRKVAAGLTPFGESVWPGVRNDLFVAHESVYHFFSRFTEGQLVVDAGCGTGYGSGMLARNGAQSVLGVDLDRRSIRYAQRHFAAANLSFRVGDCEALDLPPCSVDVIVASNVLEHLTAPAHFLARARTIVRGDGMLVVVTPPIWGPAELETHQGIHYHRSNLSIDQWIALFGDAGWRCESYRHEHTGEGVVDFSSPFRSTAQASDFAFEVTDRDGLYRRPSISVACVLRRAPSRGERPCSAPS